MLWNFCLLECRISGLHRDPQGDLSHTLMLLTQHMTYWDTVSWTNRMAFMKYVIVGVLIDNSFWLSHHNNINNGEDLVVAVRSGLLNQICQRKAAACHLDSWMAGQLIKAQERAEIIVATVSAGNHLFNMRHLRSVWAHRSCQHSGHHAIELKVHLSLKKGVDKDVLRCFHTVIMCLCLK